MGEVQSELSICADCLIWHANADDTGFCDCVVECSKVAHEDVRSAKLLPLGVHVAIGDEELGFCSSRCDACGSTFAGDRYRAFTLV